MRILLNVRGKIESKTFNKQSDKTRGAFPEIQNGSHTRNKCSDFCLRRDPERWTMAEVWKRRKSEQTCREMRIALLF